MSFGQPPQWIASPPPRREPPRPSGFGTGLGLGCGTACGYGCCGPILGCGVMLLVVLAFFLFVAAALGGSDTNTAPSSGPNYTQSAP